MHQQEPVAPIKRFRHPGEIISHAGGDAIFTLN